MTSTGPNRALDSPPTMYDALGNSARTPLSWSPHDAVVFAAAVGANPDMDLDFLDLSRGPIAVEFAGSHVIGQPLTMQVRADGTNGLDFAVHSGDQPILLGGRAELA